MSGLPGAFLGRPIAHRGLHDLGEMRSENSIAAIKAAVEHGYGIEIDVQLTADGRAMVFHDYALDRLTGEVGAVRQMTADALKHVVLSGGGGSVPALTEVLEAIGGQVPLLLEIKDQDGALGPDVGPLERAVAADLEGYDGEVAIMSFNPHSVAAMAELVPKRPRGLVTDPFREDDWPVPAPVLERLRGIPDYARIGASFVSHDARDLDCPRVRELKEAGAAILCWTVRSPEAEAQARRIADNVTFEGYLP